MQVSINIDSNSPSTKIRRSSRQLNLTLSGQQSIFASGSMLLIISSGTKGLSTYSNKG